MKPRYGKGAAVALAAAFMTTALLGGTYAWQMLGVQVANEAINLKNPGGRLHDDFNGLNTDVLSTQAVTADKKVKNVYVENFTDPSKGDDIYARIRLDEYLEIGTGAGKADGSQGKYAESVITTDADGDGEYDTKLNDVNTWTTYKWNDTGSVFRQYIALNTGSTGRAGGDTVYMPTYNKDKDNVASDVNGTLAGPDGDILKTRDAYEDFTEYALNAAKPGVEVLASDEENTDELANAGITAQDLIDAVLDEDGNLRADIDETTSSITLANARSYDVVKVDTDGDGNVTALYLDLKDDGEANHQIKLQVTEPHTAKNTLTTEKFISMDEWTTTYNGLAGPYWVYDEDGWVYWAQPIKPQTATGCMLNGISVVKEDMPHDYYYGLNVVAQFTTKDDWKDADHGFAADGGITPAAEALLEAVSNTAQTGYAAAMTMNVEADRALLGSRITFSVPGASVAVGQMTWDVQPYARAALDTTDTSAGTNGTAFITPGVLYISKNETNTKLIVTATYTDSSQKTWKAAQVLENIQESYEDVKLERKDSVGTVTQNSILQYELSVNHVTGANNAAGKNETPQTVTGVTWTVEGSSSASGATAITPDELNPTKATLTIARDEKAENLTVQVSCTANEQQYTKEVSVKVQKESYTLTLAPQNSAETGTMTKGSTRQYTATVKKSDKSTVADAQIQWSVEGNQSSDTKIEGGLLTIAEDETATPLNVKAVFQDEANDATYEKSLSVNVDITVDIGGQNIEVGSDRTVTLDGMEWYVLAVQDGKALLWSKDPVSEGRKVVLKNLGLTTNWKGSNAEAYLNGTEDGQFLSTHRLINELAVETGIKSRTGYNSDKFEVSNNKVFILTEVDVFNRHYCGMETIVKDDYTAGVPLMLTAAQKHSAPRSFLRSAQSSSAAGSYPVVILAEGGWYIINSGCQTFGLRPAFWLDLSKDVYNVKITSEQSLDSVGAGQELAFQSEIYDGLNGSALEDAGTPVWTVENSRSNETTIDANGILHVGADEESLQIIACAEYTVDGVKYAGRTYLPVRITINIEGTELEVGNTDSTVEIDGIEWFALGVQDGKALLWSKDVLRDEKNAAIQMAFGKTPIWRDSKVREYLNGKFLEEHSALASAAVMTKIKTRNTVSGSEFIETEDRIFLLSEADLIGMQYFENPLQEDYTLGHQLEIESLKKMNSAINVTYWCRTQKSNKNVAVTGNTAGDVWMSPVTTQAKLRPAFWYDYSSNE